MGCGRRHRTTTAARLATRQWVRPALFQFAVWRRRRRQDGAALCAISINRALTGEHVFERCRVLIVSLEDDTDELRRRIRAARLHYQISSDDMRGWLFLSASGNSWSRAVTTRCAAAW